MSDPEPSEYPMMLYRDGTAFIWDGRHTDTLVVDNGEAHATAGNDGWQTAVDYGANDKAESLLDKPAKAIEAELSDLDIDELETLKADETAGKARKGVLALIDTAIDAKLES